MLPLLYVMVGGAVGSGARYLTGRAMLSLLGPDYPFGTLAVNLIGGLLMGVLVGVLARNAASARTWRLLLGVGVLGGFTTFSAFSLDVVTMIERGAIGVAFGVCFGVGDRFGRRVVRGSLRSKGRRMTAGKSDSDTGFREFNVGFDDDGIRLDRWFKRHLPDTSFTTVAMWARTGQLRVDGARATPGDRIAAGQMLRVPPAEADKAAADVTSPGASANACRCRTRRPNSRSPWSSTRISRRSC